MLGATALFAGVTGAWSPCGFSMVDTLASAARERGGRVLPPACAAFSVGAVAGGAAMFGVLAAVGSLLHGGGAVGGSLAAAIAGLGAVAELAGLRIRPQVRRQVPEPWRRRLPLPVAAGLYGVLLGLGFSTFVLTYAVVALALVSLAVGEPWIGLLVGACFGAGRALPVLALAPIADTELGAVAVEGMAERPAALRGLRVVDGVALAACAALLAGGTALAATTVVRGGSDPTVAPGALAWQVANNGVLQAGGRTTTLPGGDPALGGPFVAWRNGDTVTVANRDTLQPLLTRTISGVEELAVSSRWLAYRRGRPDGGRVLAVTQIAAAAPERIVASAPTASILGRPDLDGDRLVYHVASSRGSAIREVNLRTGRRRTVVRSHRVQLLNPALLSSALVYVRVSRCAQQLRLRRRGRERVLLKGRPLAFADPAYEHGHTRQGSGASPCAPRRRTRTMLWTTALDAGSAYLTLFQPATGVSRIVRVAR